MSSKDKEISKSKLKSFFKATKPLTGNPSERLLRPDIEWELRPEQPAAQRCKALKDLAEQLPTINLDEMTITRLWELTKDLIVPNKHTEYRQTTLAFYRRLIHSQYKNLTLMREHFFLVIQNHNVPEDLRHRLELLDTLTENGKDINNFEERVGKFMLDWLPTIVEGKLLRPYLDVLTNLIKFNAAHLDNDIIVGIVQNACDLICSIEDNDIGLQCLTILEMVMSYTIFPSDPLPQCVFTLCRTVNQVHCQASWKIMKNLLGTELGYQSMKMMCNILNDSSRYGDQELLRGAVFHLNMNILGSNKIFHVPSLFYACTVLTSFLNSLDSQQVIVTYEVILSVRLVINKYKTELPEIIWDRICDIMAAIIDNIEYYESIDISRDRLNDLQTNFHENIDWIEKLLQNEKTQILANYDLIYDLIERVADKRPEASILNLIEYRSSQITATRPEWLHTLNEFVRRFYKLNNNPNVRIKTISSLMRIMELNRSSYEEEILERVVIPHFAQIAHEPNVQIRVAVAKALIEFARHCDTKRCGELLDILEKILNRPFELNDGNDFDPALCVKAETDILDIITVVDGLIEIFVVKLYRLPSYHAIKVFNILVGHLETHYDRPKIFEHANIVRYKIFNWMLKARANASYHIGYPDASNNDVIKFSHYLGIDSSLPLYGVVQNQRHQVAAQSVAHEIVSPAYFTTISIRRACKIIVKCLECDRDFQIFQLVIKELPKVLQNKALIVGNDIEALALALVKISLESNRLHHLSYKPTTDEFHSLVLPAIASLVIYYQFIQPQHLFSIISALNNGIFSNMANVCINTMTTMILEMPEILMRTLPEILLQMSKMTDTTIVAIPVLEFLSILSRLSNHLFTNFIPCQYMYVFAISLPYTKPHRYDHYTISLAHHVIAGWFLKCKLELRKNFVSYIISSIHANASMLYDDINKLSRNIRQDFNSLNEDSSNRKRSTSLTERGSRNTSNRNDSEMRPLMNDSLKSFHAELTETCIDFLARHTFSPCSALPKRLPAIEYLLKDGLSQTWLVGHNLVTITTSGCPSAPTRNGLCDRCAQLGKTANLTAPKGDSLGMASTHSLEASAPGTTGTAATTAAGTATVGTGGAGSGAGAERRYTKVSLQHSSGNESAGSTDLTSFSSSTSASASASASVTTQRQTSNSSTASLEALSRRGSNPDAAEGGIFGNQAMPMAASGAGSSTSLLGNSLSTTSVSASPTQQVQQKICIRSCTGWAEVLIRRPTGNVSWITRIENPIANDCFGQDQPFSDLVTLFLPTIHGGVFGPDFVQSTLSGDESPLMPTLSSTTTTAIATATPSSGLGESMTALQEPTGVRTAGEERRRHLGKVRPLHRQEEISSGIGSGSGSGSGSMSVASSMTTAAIDIPKGTSKRGKEVLSGSVSDGEADDGDTEFDDGGRARNPVRRVNSSPEMSSSWRQNFLAAKPIPLSQDTSKSGSTQDGLETHPFAAHQQQQQQQQKKKSVQYTKDIRVSCEAIPEEIAGSTPPQHQQTSNLLTHPEMAAKVGKLPTTGLGTAVAVAVGAGAAAAAAVAAATAAGAAPVKASIEATMLPPKQHSADDINSPGSGPVAVQQSVSGSCLAATQSSDKQGTAAKPPLSPAPAPPPLSPRLDKQKAIGNGGNGGGSGSGSATNNGSHQPGILAKSSSGGNATVLSVATMQTTDYNNGDMMRGRSKTISVVREVNGKSRSNATTTNFRSFGPAKPPINAKLCMNPSFVFLQLYHTGQLQLTDVPIKVPAEEKTAITVLDLAPPYETHKIGILYVGIGQCNNVVEMLRNSYGSVRYVDFLRGIGTLISLKEAEKNNLFLCMDTTGADGKFTYVWKDDIVQVTFHVATLMPTNLQKDPNCNEKKKHIGNDFVNIIYNESGEEYNLNTISGQFNYACVIVEPLELNTNRIYVKARPEIAKFVCHPEPKIVSDRSAPLLARQLALHANLASQVYQSLQKKNPYASNWLERLRIIKRLRTKLIEKENNQRQSGTSSAEKDDNSIYDFTKFT